MPPLQVIADAFDPNRLRDLLEERALVHDVIDATRLQRIREDMERAEARRLRPQYIESFFLEAFKRLGGTVRHSNHAPYLDYRPLRDGEPTPEAILARPKCAWITGSAGVSPANIEKQVLRYAITPVVPEHLDELRRQRLEWIEKACNAVKDRLTKEIAYWDHRAEELRLQEQAGKVNPRLNSQEARRRADELAARLQKRMEQLDLEAQISALPPVVMVGFVVGRGRQAGNSRRRSTRSRAVDQSRLRPRGWASRRTPGT